MEANDFIVRLKANGTENDPCDLQSVFDQYKVISGTLRSKDKGSFSLNVLCILCRNLEKVPSWKDGIDGKTLVSLSIDCVRETRSLERSDQVKTLACIFHIHKHVVKLSAVIPPELVLKLSYMCFDSPKLLNEYCKTYWNILADRITYIDKLKMKHCVTKLLQRLTDDATKVIQIYDSVQFCTNILTFLVKKLHFIYNESNTKDLCKTFEDIFKTLLSKKDLNNFKKLSDKDILDVYIKLSDCFYVITENASKLHFKESILNIVIRTIRTIIGHNTEMMRCLETFYLNGFYSIFEDLTNINNIENVLTNILSSCESIEKSGQEKIMYATYPFINQILRLFIEYSVANIKNTSTIYFNESIQYACLNLMLFLGSKNCQQQIKCDNCKVKSGFHDILRLLFLVKYIPTISLSNDIDVNKILPVYFKIVLMQHKILFELKKLGCVNHEKCFRKLQTDIHNTAISLNKASHYEYSIKLFNVYIEFELRYFKNDNELKNVSRALYNKSICELDFKLYHEAVIDAFLSLIFSLPDGLSSEKYMSLIMDIKAKSLKQSDSTNEEFQMISVLEACKICLEEKKYGNLKPFFIDLNFSELLKHEFFMYSKLWPSIAPIAGVWRSLHDLLKKNHPAWLKTENKEIVSFTLYEIILETPSIVRTIHNEHYNSVVTELIDMFESDEENIELQYIHAALLFLKCEFDLSEASTKYKWKTTEPTTDPDQAQCIRTISQEQEASKRAIDALHILSRAVKRINEVPKSKWLSNALRLYQVLSLQLLHLYQVLPALQVAHDCCQIARYLGDGESFVINASIIISHAEKTTTEVTSLISECSSLWNNVSFETAVCFASDAAIYYKKCGSSGMSARLVQMLQVKMLEALQQKPDLNCDLAIGHLYEAQYHLCDNLNALSTISGIQRHYLSITNTETKWWSRRARALSLQRRTRAASEAAARVWRDLLLWRRAELASWAAPPAPAPAAPAAGHSAPPALSPALARARLHALATNAHCTHDAQVKINNRLKYILGLQSSESQRLQEPPSKPQLFTPRHENLEIMLENVVFKKTQTSPSSPCTSVYGHKISEFLYHKQCSCVHCSNPYVSIVACVTSGLEASMYFRAKETDIARNYFEGSLKSFELAESKLQSYFKGVKDHFEAWLIDMVKIAVLDDFRHAEIEFLIEATFFELSQEFLGEADDLIISIHEVMQEMTFLNPYLRNEVMNLITVSAQLRKNTKKRVELNLEAEMENLKISPKKEVEPPKTPELKPKAPPKLTKIVVKNEEVPNVKRKVLERKLILDDADEEVIKPSKKKTEFKIPVPITSKAVLETITPRTRSRPAIVVSKPSIEVESTPKSDKHEFFTPTSTPGEQFYTPMSSIKTYSKKSIRNNIVKNLESEFGTPKTDKENSTVNTGAGSSQILTRTARATRSKVNKSNLKRATSPGHLVNEKPTRARVNTFKIREDDKK